VLCAQQNSTNHEVLPFPFDFLTFGLGRAAMAFAKRAESEVSPAPPCSVASKKTEAIAA
jgi:hypothetical protein